MDLFSTAVRRRARARIERGAQRFDVLHQRYARLFWTLHSVWALLTGVAVLVLAHNRYGYLPWVVLFLALTYASTLFFSRLAPTSESRMLRVARGFLSYLTRVMYQETLFFLIPFFFYSTTFPSWNSAYIVLLGVLAVLSCFDLLFDRLLRENQPFAMGFFALVSFSALLYFIPLFLHVRIHNSSYLAAALAFAAAIPLAYSWREVLVPARMARLAAAFLVALAILYIARPAIPPVPLRLLKVRYASALDPRSMHPEDEFESTVPMTQLRRGRLYVVATVFAPTKIPTSIWLKFLRRGKVLRTSHIADFLAHDKGFRVWDAVPFGKGAFGPGHYVVEVWTGEGQLVGRSSVDVVATPGIPSP